MLFVTVELGETVIVDPIFFIPPPSKDARFDKIVLALLIVIVEELCATIPPPNPADAGAVALLPLIVHELMVTVSLLKYKPPPYATYGTPPEEVLEFVLMFVSVITAAVLSLASAIPPP
jgi:hypothetical protein